MYSRVKEPEVWSEADVRGYSEYCRYLRESGQETDDDRKSGLVQESKIICLERQQQ